MKEHSKLVALTTDESVKELINAWAAMHEVDAIVEIEGGLELYLESGDYEPLKATLVERTPLLDSDLAVHLVEHKNWNAEWEANFKPIEVGQIYIRAPFHEASTNHEIDLIISPKMAFGTGHHETTYMMLDYMSKANFKSKDVLDYGCGTGILTVFAKMRGCANITGIDIQEEAVENTVEHFELNNISTSDLVVKLGDLDQLATTKYDVILANINRHVLLTQAPTLSGFQKDGSLLLMSGILQTDRPLILDHYQNTGYKLLEENTRGDWCFFVFEWTNN